MTNQFFISGVRNVGTNCERVDDEHADYWTVYQRNADNTSVAICDCQSRAQAEYALAQMSLIVADAQVRGVKGLSKKYHRLLDGHLSGGGSQIDEKACRYRNVIVSAEIYIDELRSGSTEARSNGE